MLEIKGNNAFTSVFDEEGSSPRMRRKWADDQTTIRELEASPCILESALYKPRKEDKTLKQKYLYKLYPEFILCTNKKDRTKRRVLKYTNMILEELESKQAQGQHFYGFRLRGRGQLHDFYSSEKTSSVAWVWHLTKYCIQTSLQKNYTFIDVLGKGNFAKVWLAKRTADGKNFAVKCYEKKELEKNPRIKTSIVNEVAILRQLNHKSILQLNEVFESDAYIFLVTEIIYGGELFKRVTQGKLTEKEAATLMAVLTEALDFMHKKNVIHRDLKLENILLVNPETLKEAKIVDFGLACTLDKAHLLRKCGTPGFVAPEILVDKPYNRKVDYFSLGVCLFMMLSGKPPFRGTDFQEILIRNTMCQYRFSKSMWAGISYFAIDLIKNLLNPDPAARFEAKDILNHPWIIYYTKEPNMKKAPLERYDGSHELQIHSNENLIKEFIELQRAKLNQQPVPPLTEEKKIFDIGSKAKENEPQKINSYQPIHLLQVPSKQQDNSSSIDQTKRRRSEGGKLLLDDNYKSPVVPSKRDSTMEGIVITNLQDVKKFAMFQKMKKMMQLLKLEMPPGFDLNFEIDSLMKLDSFYKCHSVESNQSGASSERRPSIESKRNGGGSPNNSLKPFEEYFENMKNQRYPISKFSSVEGSRCDVESKKEGAIPLHILMQNLNAQSARKKFIPGMHGKIF